MVVDIGGGGGLVVEIDRGIVFEERTFLCEERLVEEEIAVDTKGDFSEIAFNK